MQTSASDFTCPNNLAIMGVGIHRDAEGRYCLNDCHKAAGATKAKQPNEWLRTEQPNALIQEMAENCQSGNSRFGGFPPVSVIKGGGAPGTYAVKELVYAYAMWISPKFHLAVIRAFDALVNQRTAEADQIVREAFAITLPKAKAYDRIAGMDGMLNLTEAAKELGWPRKRFISILHEMKWIYRKSDKSSWLGYADKERAGFLSYKHFDQRDADGHIHPRAQVVVTTKGITKLARILPDLMEEAA